MIRTALTTDKPTNKQRLERRDLLGRWGLILPAGLMIFTFMALPMLVMALISVLESGNFGGVKWGAYSGDAYQKFILKRDLSDRLIVNTDYLSIFSRSFSLSAVTTVLTLLLGFPSALYAALQPPKRRQILIFCGVDPVLDKSAGQDLLVDSALKKRRLGAAARFLMLI